MDGLIAGAAASPRDAARRRAPSILQLEAVECGAACLAMVLAAHGRWVPLAELRVACGVSRDGSKAGNIVRAARRFGLEAKGFRHELAALKALPKPAILFVNLNHFVVLEGFARGRAWINDPAGGRRAMTEAELDEIYSGIVLTFAPGPDFTRGGQPPAIAGRLFAWLRGGEGALAYALASGLGLALMAILLPGFSRVFIDHYLVEGQRDWLGWLLFAMLAAALAQGGLVWLKGSITHRLATSVALRAGARFVWRMLRLPIPFFTQRYAGSIGSRAELAPLLGQHAAKEPVLLLVEGVALAVYLGVMLLYSPLLTAVAAAMALGNLVLFLVARRGVEEREQKAALDQVKLGAKTMLGLQMIESLKATGTDGPYFETWAGQHALVVGQQQAVGRVAALFATLPDFLAQAGAALVLVLGGLLVMQGQLTLGTLVAFQLLQAGMALPLRALMQNAVQMQAARGTVEQMEDVLLHPEAPEFSASPPEASAARREQRLSGALSLQGVSFGYSPLEPAMIEDFSLELVPGARVALVGPSGSGKSTVGRLVTGLFPPWSGEIRLDGRPIGSLPRGLLRDSLAVVDQEIVLFEGSVRDNIALWDETMPEAAIIAAARDAAIHDDIIARPGGYDGPVEEGGRNFSGGQRQRLEIARALVNSPSLLVLDEATSALDPIAEKQVMDNLRRRGCACLIIAHRLSTVRDCDEIIVMHRGKVLERGTHETLLAAGGAYSRLIES
ncbi:NHLP family bacteriocin export ABC transporter peptidase/permease/ATPase subunit [Teichococcus cervicalis]|uniref:NHLP bacteriocin system ABC transporter, peptidase/ATP-binding protein n=1 Tax=Pseudoroseomonas cervicalis ATCC 49957 TaxID=525371 RepID=D5RGZ9_9PROT|nr:NHLP family bacteriocin export ABC transporter peptidase/permease/ATPase subunit [Pseudoroseomonas cervicalis]EFH13418.1 NHLP bacteriocin system ABC transporter, peptidase/ATP-binding protein [Pseudoroseomonas cervicalis ATCC 49957]